MISKLDWDSNCFGYPVGKIVVDNPQDFNLVDFLQCSKEFRLVYIYAIKELSVSSGNLFLADKKVTLMRQTETLSDNYESIKSYYGKVTDRLLELTLQSSLYSRFNVDKSFVYNECRKLYTDWIQNSVNHKIAKEVYVYEKNNIILGFITLGTKGNLAEIGLVAVDLQSRGQGIGSLLIKYVVNEAWASGNSEIQVVTQLDNKSAMNLYEKSGFEVCDIVYVYHYWRK